MSEQDNKNSPNKPSNNKNRRPFNKNRNRNSSNKNSNRRPKNVTPAKIVSKYDNLLDQYILARKKFYDLFGRGSAKQVEKVKKTYDTALKSMRDYEKKLEDWQKEVLEKKTNALPEDRQYTTTHELEPKGDSVAFIGDFEDPHLLPVQKATEWSEDTDDSEGSMDDYYNYKGVTPPPPKTEDELKLEAKRITARRESKKETAREVREGRSSPSRNKSNNNNNRNRNNQNRNNKNNSNKNTQNKKS
jgi:hypothetical protein